jgi:hypothetical protein
VDLNLLQYLSNQIKDQVPSSKIEMSDAEDHRLVLLCTRLVDTRYTRIVLKFHFAIKPSRRNLLFSSVATENLMRAISNMFVLNIFMDALFSRLEESVYVKVDPAASEVTMYYI